MPLLRVSRTEVSQHHVVRVLLRGGSVLEISAGHPTADGRTFGDLRSGGSLDHRTIEALDVIPYVYPYTYDILPASSTRTYFAAGLQIGTTLPPMKREPSSSEMP